MAHELPALPYAYDALEPHIDARTMEIHHGKHHNAYVTNLNKALDGTDLADKPLEDLLGDLGTVPDAIRNAVRNNGGGHYNHSLFWTSMGPGKGGEPTGTLADAINTTFGSFDEFVWGFVDGTPLINRPRSVKKIPAETERSAALSRDLKKRGMKFVGPTVCYAFMQAVGMVNDHVVGCFRHRELS